MCRGKPREKEEDALTINIQVCPDDLGGKQVILFTTNCIKMQLREKIRVVKRSLVPSPSLEYNRLWFKSN